MQIDTKTTSVTSAAADLLDELMRDIMDDMEAGTIEDARKMDAVLDHLYDAQRAMRKARMAARAIVAA